MTATSFATKRALYTLFYIVNFNNEEKESKLCAFYYLAVIEVIPMSDKRCSNTILHSIIEFYIQVDMHILISDRISKNIHRDEMLHIISIGTEETESKSVMVHSGYAV